MHADDTALAVDSEKFCHLLEDFDRVCRRNKVKINEIKSKMMKCTIGVSARRMLALNDQLLEEVEVS